MIHSLRPTLCLAVILTTAAGLQGQVVFSNNFETGTTGFTASGTLTGLGTTSLPTDGGGLASASQSNWLGRIGYNVAKTGASDETVTLNLTGLDPGTTYVVSFDLLIGASWDGAAAGYGPDAWRLTANGTTLVDTIFSDYNGHNLGAGGAQRYSDTTYTDPNGPDQAYFAGSEFNVSDTASYAGDYAIYYFSHGSGNPVLTFVPNADGIVSLVFARYTSNGNTDSADEYWALDNVVVSAIPEPADFAPLAGLLALGAVLRRRKRAEA